jgi:hypothetical protein
MDQPSLTLVLTAVGAWIAIGALGLVRPHHLAFVSARCFPRAPRSAGAGRRRILRSGAATSTISRSASRSPVSPSRRLAVSASSCLLGAAGAAISLYSAGYFRSDEGTAPGLICFQYHVFLAAMAMVLIADDAYLFMVAWETMALASFFLVTTDHRIPEIRRAGFLYLLIAHVGAIAILLCFGVLQGRQRLRSARALSDPRR